MAVLKRRPPPSGGYYKPRRILSVNPPLPARDEESLKIMLAKINSGRTLFLGTRFTHRGSVVTISALERR